MDKTKVSISADGEVELFLPREVQNLSFSIQESRKKTFLCSENDFWHPGAFKWQVRTKGRNVIPSGPIILDINPDVVWHLSKSRFKNAVCLRLYANGQEIGRRSFVPSSVKPKFDSYVGELNENNGAEISWEKTERLRQSQDSSAHKESLSSQPSAEKVYTTTSGTSSNETSGASVWENKEATAASWMSGVQESSKISATLNEAPASKEDDDSSSTVSQVEPQAPQENTATPENNQANSATNLGARFVVGSNSGRILTGCFRRNTENKREISRLWPFVGFVILVLVLFGIYYFAF